MKHFFLVGNLLKAGVFETAHEITSYLDRRGATCCGSLTDGAKRSGKGGYTDPKRVPENTECVITLGGDGTLIQAARDLIGLQLPLIGVNMGHLGYLTQVARGESIFPMLDSLLIDSYSLDKRMMLEGCVTSPKGKKQCGIALNDIVLKGAEGMQVLKFNVCVNGEYLNEYSADGMIVATPTGSTAYNLSAGGPIVKPSAELMVLTPVCSHALNSSSIVLTHEDEVRIRMKGNPEKKQLVVFDGDHVVKFGYEDKLEIRKSSNYTTLIQLKNISFLDNLSNKMSRV